MLHYEQGWSEHPREEVVEAYNPLAPRYEGDGMNVEGEEFESSWYVLASQGQTGSLGVDGVSEAKKVVLANGPSIDVEGFLLRGVEEFAQPVR